jgi:hypothetical protein
MMTERQAKEHAITRSATARMIKTCKQNSRFRLFMFLCLLLHKERERPTVATYHRLRDTLRDELHYDVVTRLMRGDEVLKRRRR